MKHFWIITVLFALLSCTKGASESKKDEPMKDQKQAKLSENLSVKVIDAKGLDGCKFLLETSDGRRMQPINLDPTLEQDGLKLEVQVEPTQGMMSICMAGPMVKVLSAKKL